MKQDELFSSENTPPSKTEFPVTCLGKKFANDQERREYFLVLLAEKLKDPEFRKIEGFPIGRDEDILKLSNPPYYTACPNPWLTDLISQWESEKDSVQKECCYHRAPFAADVSEGKNDPIYNAHSYHTKVPYKAIMRYILHYTNPGDIVFDGFCGTGMTGIAAQMCGDKEIISSMGYKVSSDGVIFQEEKDESGKSFWAPFSKLGARKAVLNDLSPAAAFISYNYNSPIDVKAFEKEAKRILQEVELECGWMYKTQHSDGNLYPVDYYVWSEVYSCPACSNEVVFSEVALNISTGRVEKEIICPSCQSQLEKDKMELIYETNFDTKLNISHKVPKRKIFKIEYKVGKVKHSKGPDIYDLEIIEKIINLDVNNLPIVEIPDMQMMRVGRMKSSNATHLH
ncbi:site-specific DNA-methyltransferase, partial [Klebsiella oxytoca]|uniref:DNA methyltransferase n=1 Tax=Klebsiella oxytoca TaxID=571 RepID=UPI001CC9866E